MSLTDKDEFVIYSVSYKGDNETLPNNATLIGIFETLPADGALLDANNYLGIPINIPVTPAVVPRFNTLQDLADRIGMAITNFTGIDTTITVRYYEGSDTEPGSFIFEIQFEKDFEVPGLSFNSSVSLGDISELSVVDSLLNISGGFSLTNEFGVSNQKAAIMEGFIDDKILSALAMTSHPTDTYPSLFSVSGDFCSR